MIILGIETSCDETGAAVIEGQGSEMIKLLSNSLASSLSIHSKTGGIIPENAAREQVKFIIPVLKEALSFAGLEMKNVDAIAVTRGPGLIGSLLIGVETAKTLSYVFNKPLIPVNHLLGHIYANFIDQKNEIIFPSLGLIVSGGHTDLILIKKHGDYKWIGGTRDDAAGEAFDKIGRLLGLPYPGGPYIEKSAAKGFSGKYNFPKPLMNSGDFDFSFSGLKSAVFRQVTAIKKPARRSLGEGGLDTQTIADISSSVQESIIDILVKKTLTAAKEFDVKSILLGGGVAANNKLKQTFELEIGNLKLEIPFFVPEKRFCTDNGAMIAAAAYFNRNELSWQKLDADPSLYFEY